MKEPSFRIVHAEFEKSIVSYSKSMERGIPEICFIGRSNVGKSSAINMLTGRKIARTSSTPGATRAVNLFNVTYDDGVEKKKALFSDFPGFGYSKVSRDESRRWQQLIESYILLNRDIRRIVWLFDIRREMDELDSMLLEWLTTNRLQFCFVLTKCDKENQSFISKKKNLFENVLNAAPLFTLSSKTGKGKAQLVSFLLASL